LDGANRSRIHRNQWRLIIAVSAGNALEWFDFVIYGYFAVTIAKLFFPVSSDTASVLLTLITFGAAFVVRPLGALVIGNYADRHGRKPALTLTVALMTIGTAIIAFAPTFDSIGVAAPSLMLCARILQGFSAGGEFGSATAILVEQEPGRRGFFTSWQFSSQAMTAVMATAAGAVLVTIQSTEQFNLWGWRLPFIFGLLLGPIAYYIRRQIDESPEFLITEINRAPLGEVLASAKKRLMTAIGVIVVGTVAIYTLIFMPTFAVKQLGLPLSVGYSVAFITSASQVVLIPVAGTLSDKWGRLPIARTATILIFFLTLPLFAWLTAAPTFASLLAFQICIGSILAAYLGVLPALLSELFPTRMRTTGLSLSYSLAVTLFGGFAPFINASLIELTGSKLIPGYYLMTAAAVSLVALVGARGLGIR
jgi:MHS family proline/betaine transporter-like MFS transporter